MTYLCVVAFEMWAEDTFEGRAQGWSILVNRNFPLEESVDRHTIWVCPSMVCKMHASRERPALVMVKQSHGIARLPIGHGARGCL